MLGERSLHSESANMADDVLVAAITFGLTYFYYKLKQEKEKRKKIRKRRRLWMIKIHRNRTRQFIEEKFNELLHEPSGEFHNFCRMSFTDFEYLLDKISPLISKQDTDFREAIPAKYRLAITLRFIATGDSYKSLHYLFKVSPQAISKIVPEVCKAINDVLRNEIKIPPTADAWMHIESGYRRKFPHCLGSIDGKHINIESPPHTGTEYFNYKKTFSIVLLALVDAHYKFIFVDIGCQGRISDGGVFNNSLLWKKISKNEIDFPIPCPLPGSAVNVPYVFIGDGAFALSMHVMKPYPGQHNIGSPKRIFNQCLSRARVVVENTFGVLTSVFRIYRRPIDLDPITVSDITMTCVLLHNFLRKNSPERYTPPGMFDTIDRNGEIITRGSWRKYENEYNAFQNMPNVPRRSPMHAKQIREEFTLYFCNRLT